MVRVSHSIRFQKNPITNKNVMFYRISLTEAYMVRKGIHDGNPSELRHPRDVPALSGQGPMHHPQMQNFAGKLCLTLTFI